jgi:molybdopterin-guanine dinucleotide biosynthesis protein A
VTLAAIVLAGGAATRFGGDKLRASMDDGTVLDHAVAAALSVAEEVVVVVGPDEADPGIAAVTVARDAISHRGPLAGMLAGLEAIEGDGIVLVLAGDMPHVRADVLRLLAGSLAADPALGAARLETDPVATLPMAVRAAVVRPAARDVLAADRRSLRALLDSVPTAVIPSAAWRAADPRGETLHDIDVPEDLRPA